MKFLLLNDLHLGAVRSAGTTLTTRGQIQQYLQDSFKDIINEHADKDLIINGDLFDSYEVDAGQLLEAYLTMHSWLTNNPERKADIAIGNHDIAKNSMRTSSFKLFCTLLKTTFPDRVRVYDKGLELVHFGIWVIPHCTNQDSFEIELTNALSVAPGHLLLHANYDNFFAIEADHSLNVSEDMARKLNKHGHTLVFAHEHQRRSALAGQVVITGNQFPSSVSDCLAHGDGQKDGKKFAHVIEVTEDFGTGLTNVSMTPVLTWQAQGDFIAMNWADLSPSDCRFVRIEGEASSDEAADVINAIARYRQHSKAYVITNSVKIAGIAGVGDMATLSVEKLQAVNVLEALCDELTKPEADVVRNLLGEPDERIGEVEHEGTVSD
jgi:UDP-2,3-diacylglucosamine pyrophosphatase LpxH